MKLYLLELSNHYVDHLSPTPLPSSTLPFRTSGFLSPGDPFYPKKCSLTNETRKQNEKKNRQVHLEDPKNSVNRIHMYAANYNRLNELVK